MNGVTIASPSLTPTPIEHPDCHRVLRLYFADVIGSYYRRTATEAEIEQQFAEDPSDDLSAPRGTFLLARRGGELAGCVGVRLLEPGITELKRMYVAPHERGSGLGARLLDAAEAAGRALGGRFMRMETRHDLLAARALYAKHGYAEIAPYTDGPYAQRFFEKRIQP